MIEKQTDILTVLGTRPQIVKYAAIFAELKSAFREKLVDTGQHYDHALRGLQYQQLNVPEPDYFLDSGNLNAVDQVSTIASQLYSVLQDHPPRLVFCMGDTNSTLGAALAAVKSEVPVVHLEGGERNFTPTGNRVPVWSIPEETNRVITDQISHLILCASQQAVKNLEQENISGEIVFTGDIMLDLYLDRIEQYVQQSTIMNDLELKPETYCFCTIHRALNTLNKTRLKSIFDALNSLHFPVILPAHPGTMKQLGKFDLLDSVKAAGTVKLIEPLSHRDTLVLIKNSFKVITDSGGVLREAFFSSVPSVFLDDTTEWLDILNSGWTTIAGSDSKKILDGVERDVPDNKPDSYGAGTAKNLVIGALEKCLATI